MNLHDRHLERHAFARLESLHREADRARALAASRRPSALRRRFADALRLLADRLERAPRGTLTH